MQIGKDSSRHISNHLVRIPDAGVTEKLVLFADETVLDQVRDTDTRILDIGCGRGVFTEKLALTGVTVTGIDIAQNEIDLANQRKKTPGLTYHCLAAENLCDLEHQFDLIISRFCFHHLEFPQAADSLKTCIVPGGRLFIVDCYQTFWSIKGRLFVLFSAFKILGLFDFIKIISRLGYFFCSAIRTR